MKSSLVPSFQNSQTSVKLSQTSVKIQSKFSQNSVKIQSKCSQNAIKMQSKYSQNTGGQNWIEKLFNNLKNGWVLNTWGLVNLPIPNEYISFGLLPISATKEVILLPKFDPIDLRNLSLPWAEMAKMKLKRSRFLKNHEDRGEIMTWRNTIIRLAFNTLESLKVPREHQEKYPQKCKQKCTKREEKTPKV